MALGSKSDELDEHITQNRWTPSTADSKPTNKTIMDPSDGSSKRRLMTTKDYILLRSGWTTVKQTRQNTSYCNSNEHEYTVLYILSLCCFKCHALHFKKHIKSENPALLPTVASSDSVLIASRHSVCLCAITLA